MINFFKTGNQRLQEFPENKSLKFSHFFCLFEARFVDIASQKIAARRILTTFRRFVIVKNGRRILQRPLSPLNYL